MYEIRKVFQIFVKDLSFSVSFFLPSIIRGQQSLEFKCRHAQTGRQHDYQKRGITMWVG